MKKKCGKCGEIKSLTNFSKNKNRGDNRQVWCKKCARENTTRDGNTERGYVAEVIGGIFRRYKKKAARLKWKPECTRKEIYAELMLYIQDHGRHCEYCKEPWTYIRKMVIRGNGYKKRGPTIFTNFSIDRLDSTKTYTTDNLVFCCVGCNLRKNQVRLSDLINILRVWMPRKNKRKEKYELQFKSIALSY